MIIHVNMKYYDYESEMLSDYFCYNLMLMDATFGSFSVVVLDMCDGKMQTQNPSKAPV